MRKDQTEGVSHKVCNSLVCLRHTDRHSSLRGSPAANTAGQSARKTITVVWPTSTSSGPVVACVLSGGGPWCCGAQQGSQAPPVLQPMRTSPWPSTDLLVFVFHKRVCVCLRVWVCVCVWSWANITHKCVHVRTCVGFLFFFFAADIDLTIVHIIYIYNVRCASHKHGRSHFGTWLYKVQDLILTLYKCLEALLLCAS